MLARSGKKVARQRACTILLGPQLQALRRSPESAQAMQYIQGKTQEVLEHIHSLDPTRNGDDMVYDDIMSGVEYLTLHQQLNISGRDTMVSLSVDGAQLYQNKKSDTWIGIWIVNNLAPDLRYKQEYVPMNFTVPGPNKPKHLDSFMFRGLHHLSALQHENNGRGLRVWDAEKNETYDSRVIFALAEADFVALKDLEGSTGHHGAHACQLGCPMQGWHKNSGHYYPVHHRPTDYTQDDIHRTDVDIRNLHR